MSMLRSSKFFKYFISYTQNIVTRHREIDGTLLRRSLNLAAPPSRFLNQAAPRESNVEKFVQRLDQDVRRSGRVTRRELEDVFREMKNARHATGTQSLMVIRCCGNLIPEEKPEVRTKLVNDIWKTLEKIGVPLDVSHYNALLKVYLENEHKFSPTDFLADLQQKGVEPNRVTYQRLIAAYCQRGDIDGATKILEFMKEKQLPVNESVFCSLINGHFQADDPESAVGILSVMKQANIVPSAETYTVLMCGYAKSGNLSAINDVLSQCEKDEVDITDRDILEIAYTLAINKHTDLMEDLFGKLKILPGYNQDAKNVILRLLVHGEDKASLKVLRTMKKITSTDGDSLPAGNFLIKHMVKCGRPLENIIDVCKELKESGENENALLIATEASLVHGDPVLSSKLLTVLSKEHEVCQHYYWPILVQYGKKGKLNEMKSTLSQMIEEVGQPVSGETLRDYVAPYVPEGEKGIYTMRDGGVPLATGAAAMVGHLLTKNDIQAAAKIALQFRANYSSTQLCKSIVSAFADTKDLDSFITFARVINDFNKEEQGSSSAEKMIVDAVKMMGRTGTSELVRQILQGYLDAGIRIRTETADEIQNVLHGKELTEEISSLLSKLTSPDLTPVELDRPEISRRQSERPSLDEAAILRSIKIASSRGDQANGLKRQLLGVYCANRELEKAEQLCKELEESGFEYVTGSLVQLMELYISQEKLDEALKYYNKIFSSNPDIQIDPSKILKLGSLMISLNRTEEALELFRKHKIEPDSLQKGFNTNATGWRLLNSIAEKKDVETLKNVFNVLVESNLIEPNNVMLGPLIKVHMLRDDIDGALAEFEQCCQKYRATPWKNEIACKLIQKEDPVSLQKLTDLSTDIHGEINSLYDLVLAFIECGKIRQARKILETPGLRLKNQRISSACERYNNEGKVTHLESLVEATRDLGHIDRSDIYYHLLLSYCKTDEITKAEGLWTQMQDEDVQPTDQFLIKLAQLLKKHGKSVPFAVPANQGDEESEKKPPKQSPSLVKTFRKVINSGNADEAVSIMSRLKDSDLSNTDRSRILNLLLSNGRIGEASKILIDWLERGYKPNIRALNTVLNSLAKAGDVDTFNVIGKSLNSDYKKMTSFTNRLTHCMVEAGRAGEVLTKLDADIKGANSEEELKTVQVEFPRGGIFSILGKLPDSISKIEELAKAYREKGILEPTNVLWAYYYSKGNHDKARELWAHISSEKRLALLPILKEIRLNKDVALARHLLSFFKESNVPVVHLAPVYCALLDVENMSGNLDECEKILKEALNDCQIDDLRRTTLLRLKRSFEAEGKAFNYSLPQNRRKVQDSSSSSSSSDSDSDSETPEKVRAR